ncbi:hypothetical protein [Flavobacterium marginilacus]|uniref:hypothetical protein n=1 Tax=Flavobacterium marginilacus TaxID=3003256 RepID=UPI00248D6782|nr:hypothetical protein [Flavobacterium marginilacus]
MKTNALITRKTSLHSLIVFLGLIITSCGSYQNSSYYDSDGIYGANGENAGTKNNQTAQTSVQYKEYFNSLQSTGVSGEIFTDVNSYSSGYNTENDSIQAPSTGYASWGSSPQETTITVYPDTSWYFGYGWNHPYYGYNYGYGYPYYGWDYPRYGWGYPNYGYSGYGYGYSYYGWGYPGYSWGYSGYGYPGYRYNYSHATPYAYNYSRRGSSYGGNYNNNRVSTYDSNRSSFTSRNSTTGRNSIYYNRNSTNDVVNRRVPTFTNRNNYTNSASRNYNQSQSQYRNSNYTQSRTYTPSQNTQRSSYTPSSNSSYRSSSNSSNMSSGSSRMSSGGDGGRTGGGRR